MKLRMRSSVITLASALMLLGVFLYAEDDQNGQRLDGSFAVSVVPDGLGGATFPGLVTYTPTGGAMAVELVPTPGLDSGEDHGGWVRTGHNQYRITFIKMATVHGTNTFAGYIKSRATVTASGDTFTGNFRIDFLPPGSDPNSVGSPATKIATGFVQGNRIKVQPIP